MTRKPTDRDVEAIEKIAAFIKSLLPETGEITVECLMRLVGEFRELGDPSWVADELITCDEFVWTLKSRDGGEWQLFVRAAL